MNDVTINGASAETQAQALRGAIEAQIPAPGAICVTAAETGDATEAVALSIAHAFAESGHTTLFLDASGETVAAGVTSSAGDSMCLFTAKRDGQTYFLGRRIPFERYQGKEVKVLAGDNAKPKPLRYCLPAWQSIQQLEGLLLQQESLIAPGKTPTTTPEKH